MYDGTLRFNFISIVSAPFFSLSLSFLLSLCFLRLERHEDGCYDIVHHFSTKKPNGKLENGNRP